MEYEYQLTVNGRRIRATASRVTEALRGVAPEKVRTHAVRIGGLRYPVKQAFAVAFGFDRDDFITRTARRVFLRLGFDVSSHPTPAGSAEDAEERGTTAATAATGVRPRFPRASGLPRPPRAEVDREDGKPVAQVQALEIAPIVLEWSAWVPWNELWEDNRVGPGARIPEARPGVYEVMVEGKGGKLVIGRASDLRARIKQAMIRASTSHQAGDKIRRTEDTSRVFVRWALTDWPAAAEEALHKQHVRQHGSLPKHTQHT